MLGQQSIKVKENIDQCIKYIMPKLDYVINNADNRQRYNEDTKLSAYAHLGSDQHFSKFFKFVLTTSAYSHSDFWSYISFLEEDEAQAENWLKTTLKNVVDGQELVFVDSFVSQLISVAKDESLLSNEQRIKIIRTLLRLGDILVTSVNGSGYLKSSDMLQKIDLSILNLLAGISGLQYSQELSNEVLQAFLDATALETSLCFACSLFENSIDQDWCHLPDGFASKCINSAVDLAERSVETKDFVRHMRPFSVYRFWSKLCTKNKDPKKPAPPLTRTIRPRDCLAEAIHAEPFILTAVLRELYKVPTSDSANLFGDDGDSLKGRLELKINDVFEHIEFNLVHNAAKILCDDETYATKISGWELSVLKNLMRFENEEQIIGTITLQILMDS